MYNPVIWCLYMLRDAHTASPGFIHHCTVGPLPSSPLPSPASPLGTTNLLSALMLLFCLICCVFFLYSTYEWNNTAFVFLHQTFSLSVMHSKSICVVADGNISAFYVWIVFHCVYMHMFIFFGKISIRILCPFFSIGLVCLFVYWVMWILYRFWILTPYQT